MEQPFESIVWYDLYLTIPGIEGEVKMTFTDKGESTDACIDKTLTMIKRYKDKGITARSGLVSKASGTKESAETPKEYEEDNPMRIVRIEIKPHKENIVRVDFYKAGMKYPHITEYRNPEKLAPYLAKVFDEPYMPEDFVKPAVINCECDVHWVYSDKLKKTGKPYMNVEKIVVVP